MAYYILNPQYMLYTKTTIWWGEGGVERDMERERLQLQIIN